MNIPVPLIEPQSENGCMPTALSMIMNYYGDMISEKQILEEIGGIGTVTANGSVGTFITEGALFAKKRGYEVTCYSYNMRLLSPLQENLKRKRLRDCLEANFEIERTLAESETYARIYGSYLSLLDSNANLRIRMPDIEDIKGFLKNNVPLLLNINVKSFYKSMDYLDVGHSIVVTGFNKNKIFYNDPADGKRHEINESHLLYSLSVYSFDRSAYLLAITPK